MSEELLKQATELLKQGQKEQAEQTIKRYLRDNREDWKAWWILANSAGDSEVQRKSLAQLLKLNPSFERAKQMLASLEQTPAPTSPQKTTTEMLSAFAPPPSSPVASPVPQNYSKGRIAESDQDWFFGIHANPDPKMIEQYKKQDSKGGGMSGIMSQPILLGCGGLGFVMCCCCMLSMLSSSGG